MKNPPVYGKIDVEVISVSMMFSGSRDFIGEIGGVKYYSDFDGTIYRDDGFSCDAIATETPDKSNANGWISVKDAMPKHLESVHVLVQSWHDKSRKWVNPTEARWNAEENHWECYINEAGCAGGFSSSLYLFGGEITHWQPWPEPYLD